mgnify:CR=1 FL=1|jgi:hypothetical protein
MKEYEKQLIDRCIESHYNMIKHHRRAIIELCRRKSIDERCMECFDFEIINESGRSGKSEERS